MERAGADWLHLDVMDGHFVPNITFGPLVVKALRRHTKMPLDVHLMIAPADPYIAAFAEAGADHISVHPESGPHLHRTLQLIRSLGKKSGVVLNPATPVEAIAHVLDLVDIIMVMTVNPGFGGQAFIASQLGKIATLRRMIDATGRAIILQIDGGITPATAPGCACGRGGLPDRRHRRLWRTGLRHGHRRSARRRTAPDAGSSGQQRMSGRDSFSRGTRAWLARLQNLRTRNAPDAPALGLRDPWPGDPSRGARLVKGELEFSGAVLHLAPGVFYAANATPIMRGHAHGFTWLRDLRALGTDAARTRARALVSEFMDTEPLDSAGTAPDVTGARLAAWLGHYDFFAASADDDFRQRLMSRLVMDARNLSALLPVERLDGRALTALKGLLAASVAMPDHVGNLPRVLKFLQPEIKRQFFADGSHIERSPGTNLAALQDLTEIRALLQAAGAEPPPELLAAIERGAAALRALRHGDGGLALFNGSKEELGSLIDLVLGPGRARARPPGNTEQQWALPAECGQIPALHGCRPARRARARSFRPCRHARLRVLGRARSALSSIAAPHPPSRRTGAMPCAARRRIPR